MKTKIFLLFAWAMLTALGCSAEGTPSDEPQFPPVEKPGEPSGDPKVLVVYFSHTGNTRTIAGYIHEKVQSDLVELETVDTYTDDYDPLLAQIRKEVAASFCPPLTTQIGNIASYDVIFVGYPIWVETAAPPVRTFLTTHNLAGKTVVPLVEPVRLKRAIGSFVAFVPDRPFWRVSKSGAEHTIRLING